MSENGSGFSAEEAKTIGEQLGIDWRQFDVEQFRMGFNVELEHGQPRRLSSCYSKKLGVDHIPSVLINNLILASYEISWIK